MSVQEIADQADILRLALMKAKLKAFQKLLFVL